MTTQIPTQFTGYGAKDEASGKKLDLDLITYTPKTWEEIDVDVKISHCGICGSDLHTLTNGWAGIMPTSYACIAGHESVGSIVRAGAKSGHVVGTRVGVGAQSGSCQDCDLCRNEQEHFCKSMVMTYQGKWNDGTVSQGGYSDFIRCQGRFAVPIPDSIASADAAPLLCAGVTTFCPLKRFGCGPGKKVGVVGIGGLGHLALQWAAAMGAETFALSHSSAKAADAEKLGVKPENFIITKDDAATVAKYSGNFDIILCTSSALVPIESLYFQLLRPMGALVLLGAPDDKLPGFYGQALLIKNLILAGTFIGSPDDIREMYALAALANIRPWNAVRPMSEASQAAKDTENGLARYRFVLEN